MCIIPSCPSSRATSRRSLPSVIVLLIIFLLAACNYPQSALPGISPSIETQLPLLEPPRTSFQPQIFFPLAFGANTAFSQPENIGSPPQEVEPVLPLPASPVPVTGLTLYLDEALPDGLKQFLALPEWLALTTDEQNASLVLTPGGSLALGYWVYALVAPFPTYVRDVTSNDLSRAWRGRSSEAFGREPLLMDADTYLALAAAWGEAETGAVEVVSSADMLDIAWNRQQSWAILPFHALEPRWKVLAIDGQSPIHKDFDLREYGLSLPVSVSGEGMLPELLSRDHGIDSDHPMLSASNHDPQRLTILAMTGVTALVRATAFTMEQRGVTYPAQDIGPILRQADLTHISNEVPFARDCPFPNPVQEGLKFCSAPKYIELLEEVGADIVELTGDHFADWGTEAMRYTLDLYEERGWLVYGGGRNLRSGRAPQTLEHNGNHLAFIGCNAKGGSYAQAGEDHPGAVVCDFPWMEEQILRLAKDGYLVIATFQHFEYYTYIAQPNQIADSQRLAEAGAVVVSGSQAHQPQSMEFYRGAFIHYGLGNLFFDQLDVSPATRQGFIDFHIFYNGRHISTELVPILFVDYARARPMTQAEMETVLSNVFSASGW